MNLFCLLPCLARHFLPEKVVRALLLRNITVQSGLKTSNRLGAIQRYVDALSKPLAG